MRARLNLFFESRTFYIIFAILASIALWLYVAYVQNDNISVQVAGVPVSYINGAVVTDKQLVVTDYGPETVALRFSGKRGEVTKLTNATVSVSVDLSQITGPGRSQLQYAVTYPDSVNARNITIIGRSDDWIPVSAEKIYTKAVRVEAVYSKNVAAEEYQAASPQLMPETVTVQGPQTVVDRIETARVDILRENLTKTVVEDTPYTFMDADGKPVPSDGLLTDYAVVKVTIPIAMVRDMPLNVKLSYGAGATEANTVVTILPDRITLSGDAAALNFNYIQVGQTIDTTRFETAYTAALPIYVPNELTNLTGAVEATVTVTITGLEIKRLSAADIQLINVTPRYTASLITTSVDIAVRGAPGTLEALTAENIRVVADLSELGEAAGTFTVPAHVYLDGDFGDAGAVGEYKVAVRVMQDVNRTAAEG